MSPSFYPYYTGSLQKLHAYDKQSHRQKSLRDAKQEKNGIAQSHMLYHAHDLHMYTESGEAQQEAGEKQLLQGNELCAVNENDAAGKFRKTGNDEGEGRRQERK